MHADWATFVPFFAGFILSLAWHESAHAWTAWKLGDSTGRALGRITLNPIPHIDPFGTLLLPVALWWSTGMTFGYAKPVPYNPYALKNPALGSAMIAGAGPASNFVLAGIATLFLAFLNRTGAAHWELGFRFLRALVSVNVWLALFNLIPLPPLDGSKVLGGLLPRGLARAYERLDSVGFILLFVVMYTGVLTPVLTAAYRAITDPLFDFARVGNG